MVDKDRAEIEKAVFLLLYGKEWEEFDTSVRAFDTVTSIVEIPEGEEDRFGDLMDELIEEIIEKRDAFDIRANDISRTAPYN